jgi:dTDP-4-amino-4,6-dideoxygalactose transaminase
MTKIPLVDLKLQRLSIQKEIDLAIKRTLLTTDFSLGKNIDEFEKNYATFCGVKYAVGTASGTSALHMSLLSFEIGPGDEVISVPNTFIATIDAISYVGATPILVDVDPITYTINPANIERVITKKTKAIIAVHLYGHPADMIAINNIAKKYSLFVIEDACQAHGAEINDKRVGTFGSVAAFSFYPSKVLGACGEAGCVTTNDRHIAQNIKILRNHGQTERYTSVKLGYNYLMDGMQAAILNQKLSHLETWIVQRREKAAYFNRLFEKNVYVTPPQELPGYKHVYHLYVIRVKEKRDELRKYLLNKGISTEIHYPIPIHLQESYKRLNIRKDSFPIVESLSKQIISLPLYPELKDEQIEYVVNSVNSFYN